MRLTDAQVHALINGLTPFIHGARVELRLYGSRVHDHMKGGDIDLLILTEQAGVADSLMELKHVLLSNMKKFIGDQKIDLKIVAQEDVATDSFLKMVLPSSILLHRW
jgi:hypothetical protein